MSRNYSGHKNQERKNLHGEIFPFYGPNPYITDDIYEQENRRPYHSQYFMKSEVFSSYVSFTR